MERTGTGGKGGVRVGGGGRGRRRREEERKGMGNVLRYRMNKSLVQFLIALTCRGNFRLFMCMHHEAKM